MAVPPVIHTSLVIPTFNEADNISTLLDRLGEVLTELTEIIFVDDSSDDTPEVIEKEAQDRPVPIQVLHREEPIGGLGGAVVEGIRLARGRWIVVMDADLQHPPDLVPALLATGEETGAQLVVASRYAAGGSRAGLAGGYRLAVSSLSTLLAKLVFLRRLRGVSDPMSGFFAIRRDIIAPGTLRPLGYKILLELIVRTRPRPVAEVPYVFGERHAGDSKSSMREGFRFLRHLALLRTTNR
jgi:dolichol-phosphate mannosyltransferase